MNCSSSKLFFVLAISTLLAACSHLLPNTDQSSGESKPEMAIVVIPDHEPVDDLMRDYLRAEKMDAEQLSAVFEETKNKFLSENKSEDRMRYILLLAMPDRSFYNREAALKLLKEWPQLEEQSSGIIGLRNFLLARLEEENRMIGKLKRVAQKIKIEEERSDMLQTKINEIREMEKAFNRRDLY